MVELLQSDAPIDEIASAAADASDLNLSRASGDPLFQFITGLLVNSPHKARSPDYADFMFSLGMESNEVSTVPALLAGLSSAIDRAGFELGMGSDAGEMAKAALLESLSSQLQGRMPGFLETTATDVRQALAYFSSGKNFAILARDFFARLTHRSLDYYLSREFANHTGEGQRFETDADRVAFQNDLAVHTFEASKIVEEFAGGWYGKTIWQKQDLSQEAINRFTSYAFKKLRSELGRKRQDA